MDESSTRANDLKSEGGVPLGGLLNAIDGVVDSDARILLVTTNHIDRLGPALLRPGRIDLKLNLDCMTPELFELAFAKFFPQYELPKRIQWKTSITPAEFQGYLLRYPDKPETIFQGVQLDSLPNSIIWPKQAAQMAPSKIEVNPC